MSTPSAPTPEFKPFVPDEENLPEFRWYGVLIGAILGIIFGASSMYLVLKVGLTVSASIPVAVLSIPLFRIIFAAIGEKRSPILVNNIVQTTGCAGESLAFAIGLIMPALLLLGFDIDLVRVMVVGVLGGLLGILMMIPLRRAFIVKQHGKLIYPEGVACAEVLKAGEKGGFGALLLFFGFLLSGVYQFLMNGWKLWEDTLSRLTSWKTAAGKTAGLKGGTLGMELNPALLGVGYIIGPRIACIMLAGAVMAYLVISPAIVFFGENLTEVLPPAKSDIKVDEATGTKTEMGLISNLKPSQIRNNYILYIGAGAVAAGGILSMLQALPVIFSSILGSLRDLRANRREAAAGTVTVVSRTARDLPLVVVFFGSLFLVFALAAIPKLGLGLSATGFLGGLMIVVFGFLFVTVSSRITGEIGSSSNPISGMTVATLLLTCLLMLVLSEFGIVAITKEIKLTVLTIAGVVCIASSNGGSTAQALKTGHLLGATPSKQQWAILIGSLSSAIAIGFVLILLNDVYTTYTKKELPTTKVDVSTLSPIKEKVKVGPYAKTDQNEYYVLNVGRGEKREDKIPAGRYLVDDSGKIVYLVDPAVNGQIKVQDELDAEGKEQKVPKFDAPKTVLMQFIIDGVLDGNLPWDLVLIGVMIAVTMQLCGVPALPFAVGLYLPMAASTPIFLGGMARWLVDKLNRTKSDDDTSSGTLFSAGLIAGGSITAVVLAFLNFNEELIEKLERFGQERILSALFSGQDGEALAQSRDLLGLVTFGILVVILLGVGLFLNPKKKD